MEHQHTPNSHPQSPEPSNSGPFIGNTAPTQSHFDVAVAKGYEPHDLGLRMVFIFIGGLVSTLIVVLAFIYFVMMAMAAHDRSNDAIASPVTVKLPAVYAPLQPSLGFYEQHDQDHDVLDAADMLLIRERTAKVLGESGTGDNGRRFVSIDTAMDTVVANSLLVSKPGETPTTQPTNPNQHEGIGNVLFLPDAEGVHANKMKDLNGGDE